MNTHRSWLTPVAAMVIMMLLLSQQTIAQVNYVRTYDAKAPEQDGNKLLTKGLREVQQTTQYFDGLGRPLQTVVKQGSYATNSNGAVDIVSPIVYDAFGREVQQYLPYAATTGDGMLRPVSNVLTDQAAFYNGTDIAKNPIAGQGESFFYSRAIFEASPLNRVREQFAPGNSWAGTASQTTEANRKSVKIKYFVNSNVDAVRIWRVPLASATGNWGAAPATSATYDPGQLYKTITIDEHNKQVIEFKDKEGKVILKKVQLDGTAADEGPGQAYAGWMCTYYLYDDLGNPRCVVQPEGVKALEANGWAFTSTILDEQCFRYEYDHRNRMILKKVPGVTETNAVWMVYDTRDRLVMTQDGKQRAQSPRGWMVTLYDGFNRPIQTGYLSASFSTVTNKTFTQILADAAGQVDYPFAATSLPSAGDYTVFTQTGYDDYNDMSGAGFASTLSKDLDNTYTGSAYLHSTYNTSPLYAQPLTQSFQTQGLITWTKTRVLDNNSFEYAVNIYDDKARLVQVKHQNFTGGISTTTTQYSWVGQALRVVQYHHKALNTAQTSIVITDMSYDDLGRLTTTKKKISNSLVENHQMPGEWTTIAENQYDALGQLSTKQPGKKRNADKTYSSTALATLDYNYNIRGWPLSINKNYMSSTEADRYFAMELGYDKDPTIGINSGKRYNGNIGSIIWKSAGDQQRRKYDFNYDAANRLLGAAFGQYASGTGATALFNTSAGIDFTVSGLDYDYNGNITGMTQRGLKLNTSPIIDQLTYTYEPGSNRLQKVSEHPDIVAASNGKLGDFKDGANASNIADYAYNENGSLTKDENRAISSITYNHLNLPSVITITGKGTITYTYDAAGNKLKKTTVEPDATVPYNNTNYSTSITSTTIYLSGFIYESKTYSNSTLNSALGYTDKLQFAAHEEGRIRALYTDAAAPHTPKGFVYDYFIKDYLGNVRIVLTDELKEDSYPLATMETAQLATEEKYFANISSTQTAKPAGYPADPTTSPNDYAAKVNGSGNKIGPSILLKVMAGDKFNIAVNSWYKKTNGDPASPTDLLNSLIAALAGGVSNAAPAHGTASQLVSGGTLDPAAMGFIQNRPALSNTGKPKAYLNWVFLDEQLKFDQNNGAYGGDEVGDETQLKPHAINDIEIKKNGYFFVYVSNETPNIDVFFDNLKVLHKRGALLEETHYYPFGLTMAGISSKALNGIAENRNKFNGGNGLQNKEFSDGSGLELYDATFRVLDPQIGRFHQVDPLAAVLENLSPYSFANNNPILFSDPFGLAGDTAWKTLPEVVVVGRRPNSQPPSAGIIDFNGGRKPPESNQALQGLPVGVESGKSRKKLPL